MNQLSNFAAKNGMFVILFYCLIFNVQCSPENNSINSVDRLVIKLTTQSKINADRKSLRFSKNINDEASLKSLQHLNQILQSEVILFVAPLVANQTLTDELNKYLSLILRTGTSDAEKKKLLELLRKTKIVSHAYIAPVGEDAGMETPGN